MKEEHINWGLIGVAATVVFGALFLLIKKTGENQVIQSGNGWQPRTYTPGSPIQTPMIPLLSFGDGNGTSGNQSQTQTPTPVSILYNSHPSYDSQPSKTDGGSCGGKCGGCKETCYASSNGNLLTSMRALTEQLTVVNPKPLNSLANNIANVAMGPVQTFQPPSVKVLVTGYSSSRYNPGDFSFHA
jgi:hypothetical protein